MRITFVLPGYDLSGGNRVLAIYADRLRRRGHDVFVIAPPPRKLSLSKPGPFHACWPGWPAQRRQDPSHFDGLGVSRRTLERWRPLVDSDVPDADVIVASWWETAEWVEHLSPRKGAKAYFIQGDEPSFAHPADRVAQTWQLPMQKITCGRNLADIVRNRTGDTQVIAVPNSVDFDQFHAEPRGKQPWPTVGMLYSTHPVKGCDVGLGALAMAA